MNLKRKVHDSIERKTYVILFLKCNDEKIFLIHFIYALLGGDEMAKSGRKLV